jgi:UDP-glucose 4-epimerase
MKPSILVTGGAGYIGSHCCKSLWQQGFDPIVVDNLIYGHRSAVKWGEFIYADIGDVNRMESIFKSHKIDAVMHFSAFAYVGESVTWPDKYYTNNLCSTINLLNCMVRNNVRHFVFSSTCATYGDPEYTPIDEKHPQCPINPYGKTKLMVEQLLEDYGRAYGLNYICLRYFNAAGADPEREIGELHDPETHLIPLVLDAVIGKRPSIKVFGSDYPTTDGTCVRDYIHVTDLANAHIMALKYLFAGGKSDVINLGTGVGNSVLEIIDCAKKITGKEISVEVVDRRPGDPPALVAANNKSTSVLGWKPKFVDISEIIRTAWLWHQKYV